MTFKINATIMNRLETAEADTATKAAEVGEAFFARHASNVTILAPGRSLPLSVADMRQAIEQGDYA